ncbi:JDVT-CTERM system glutamic-type intramembrane protease MrtJ [Halodesulfovibrio aestuarii]|uniref:CAAX prenyl protease 2/Lysostaphin resistance protein A-like domain-containing protein n=1 Tax=Halodesulfovibrio aestuarii TaxID=126333 RepID=A0A8G2CA77_9BACT|nr:JDVT-CTERM system glutamic-type intramembrane protease [Halodesulfovibrio aestuarii]SHJ27314.1 hypothetical protein SAMN05660830_02022 [Halodesulfovibrio aestuarii]
MIASTSIEKYRFTFTAFLLTSVALLLPDPATAANLPRLLIGACAEEIIFRGLLQDFLSKTSFCNQGTSQNYFLPSRANVITSLLFAVFHLFSHSPLWAMATFFPSLLLGAVWDRHQSLAICIALHLSYNLGYYYL